MKTVYSIDSGFNMFVSYWDMERKKITDFVKGVCIENYNIYRERYILCDRTEELTGRWKTTKNKQTNHLEFHIEVKWIIKWFITHDAYTEVIEPSKTYYETKWKFFKVRKYTDGVYKHHPKKVVEHKKESLHWVREGDVHFHEKLEESDFEVTINECE